MHLLFLKPFLQRETTFVPFCLHALLTDPSRMRSTLKGKNLLLEERIIPIKNWFKQYLFPEKFICDDITYNVLKGLVPTL